MKIKSCILLGFGVLCFSQAAFSEGEKAKTEHKEVEATEKLAEYTLKVESKDGKTLWTPPTIEVKQGEKFILKMEHDVPKGFAFHGVEIADLKIRFQVNRGHHMQTNVEIPQDMKPGEYEIKCQFHPAHVSSKLIVKAK